MTTIGIQNSKLIVTNDYQQFLAHFEWFLALIQISDVKPELSPVRLKVCQNGIFKNLFPKKFSRLVLTPKQSYVKKSDQKSLLMGFLSMSITMAPYGRVKKDF